MNHSGTKAKAQSQQKSERLNGSSVTTTQSKHLEKLQLRAVRVEEEEEEEEEKEEEEEEEEEKLALVLMAASLVSSKHEKTVCFYLQPALTVYSLVQSRSVWFPGASGPRCRPDWRLVVAHVCPWSCDVSKDLKPER
ncbi:uncharacterized protein V6R79_007755 [Siganus canaliculatus]